MSNAKGEPVYYNLVIVAASPATEIWLGDDGGHLVQKEIGTLETSLLPGDYTVEFGLGTSPYPIRLAKSSRYAQGTCRWANLLSPGSKAFAGVVRVTMFVPPQRMFT